MTQNEWQPIDSAPKDGSAILAWPVEPMWSDVDIPYVLRWDDRSAQGYASGWREAAGEEYEFYEPTHWQPLPPSPESKP